MTEGKKCIIFKKLFKSLGLTDVVIEEAVLWIKDLLMGKNIKDVSYY